MAVTEMELNEALSRAASLMSPEGQRRIEFASRNNANNFDENGNFNQPTGTYGMRNNIPLTESPIKKNNATGLPKAIRESIMQNPLNDTVSDFSVETSVLDNINYTPKQQHVQESYYSPNTMTSSQPVYGAQPMYQQPQQYMAQPMNIDYNYIRAIVNECVQANLQLIKEELLKESSLKAIRLGSENKIQLIDNKNNLYESKLEFKKNLTKK